jgi:lipoate synthase
MKVAIIRFDKELRSGKEIRLTELDKFPVRSDIFAFSDKWTKVVRTDKKQNTATVEFINQDLDAIKTEELIVAQKTNEFYLATIKTAHLLLEQVTPESNFEYILTTINSAKEVLAKILEES